MTGASTKNATRFLYFQFKLMQILKVAHVVTFSSQSSMLWMYMIVISIPSSFSAQIIFPGQFNKEYFSQIFSQNKSKQNI